MTVEELLQGSKVFHHLEGPTVFYLPWSLWYKLALELGPRASTERLGLLCDYRGDVYIATSSIGVSMHHHAHPRATLLSTAELP